jgi:hypothetical protein
MVGSNWPLSAFQPNFVVDPNSPEGQKLTISKTYGFNPGETLPKTFVFDPVMANSPTFTTALGGSSVDFSKFVGSGTISSPFTAAGISSFTSSSGNGGGGVMTEAGVTMTVRYVTVPEPTTLVLLGLGGVSLLFVRLRRQAASL